MAKKPKLGSGKRFSNLTKSIQKSSGYTKEQAQATAAMIGRKMYGNKKMAKMAAAGKKKK